MLIPEGVDKKLEFEKFVEWMGTPPDMRQPKEQKELAQQLNVAESTLSDWKKIEDFWSLVKSYQKAMFAHERTLKLLDAWYVKILANPKAQDMELWLQYYDDFSKKTDLNINTDVIDAKKKLEDLLGNNYQKQTTDDNQSGTESGTNEDPVS